MVKIAKYLDNLISQSKPTSLIWNVEKKQSQEKPSWNYIDGCMMNSLLELYQITKDKKYFEFVEEYLDYFIDKEGNILGYDVSKYALDDICSSRILFFMYDKTHDERYLKAIEHTYEQIKHQPRTYEGNFWHKKIYPNQVWLDGFYMVMPFYTLYTNHFLQSDYQDIVTMYKIAEERMYDSKCGLFYHGYDASKSIFWANKKTGLSQSFWLRAIGWFLCSIVDVYEYLQDEKTKLYFQCLLEKAITGILPYLDKTNYMFYQVVDKGEEVGNYLETSGSAMVAYTLLKGVRLKMLDLKYYDIGEKIFAGITKRYFTCQDDVFTLNGICLVAGLGPENNLRRDGTYQYYISEPVVKNEAKGIAPFIMAYIELIRGRR